MEEKFYIHYTKVVDNKIIKTGEVKGPFPTHERAETDREYDRRPSVIEGGTECTSENNKQDGSIYHCHSFTCPIHGARNRGIV